MLLSGAIGDGRSVLAAQVAGADLAYVGSVFLSTHEANISEEYRQMVLDSTAADIVYSSLFSGVHANYLRGSIVAAGLDPDDLPAAGPATMDFAPDRPEARAWRDIWGSGQGIGAVTRQQSVAALVESLSQQYDDALLTPVWDGRRQMAAADNVETRWEARPDSVGDAAREEVGGERALLDAPQALLQQLVERATRVGRRSSPLAALTRARTTSR